MSEKKPQCKYGLNCYRKNFDHWNEYDHLAEDEKTTNGKKRRHTRSSGSQLDLASESPKDHSNKKVSCVKRKPSNKDSAKTKKKVKTEDRDASEEDYENKYQEDEEQKPRKLSTKKSKKKVDDEEEEEEKEVGEKKRKYGVKGVKMDDDGSILINRAPVLTLWAAEVASQQGYDWDTAVTLGRAIAGMFAYAKGKSIGLMSESSKTKAERAKERGESSTATLMGRQVYVRETDDGLRALTKGKAIPASTAHKYLKTAFGDKLKQVRSAMQQLAKSFSNEDLDSQAYSLYEQFRPVVPKGERGWGARGKLDLDLIRNLASQ